LISEREKILKLKTILLTSLPFTSFISPILFFNYTTYGKFSTEVENLYPLVTFKFQTELWHQKLENLLHEGLFSAFSIDPLLFIKNYFYNLLYHNPDHLFKFTMDTFDSLSIIPILPFIGMIPVIGGFLYITKINLTRLNLLVLLITFSFFVVLVLIFGEMRYHFLTLIVIPLAVIGLSNIKKIPKNISFLLLFTIVFMLVISLIPVYKAYQLLPIWLIFPALSSVFFIKSIPIIQTTIKQLIQLKGNQNEI
jgi:hypothetical protein